MSLDARGRPLLRKPVRALQTPPLEVEALASRITGRRCVVVGSAPLRAPVTASGAYVVVVNGAISSVAFVPDLWLVNSRQAGHKLWLRERKLLNTAMMAQCRGRHVETVGFLTRQQGAEADTAAWLADLGCTFGSSVVIGPSLRERIEWEAGARTDAMRKHACSAGVFAACVCLWAGAVSVELVGFSWRPGYQYLPGAALPANARAHVQGDQLALKALLANRAPLSGDLVPRRKVA